MRKSDRTRVTVERLRRDAQFLRDHAAVVIVLGQDGQIKERIVRNPRNKCIARLIAVLAPVVYCGECIDESCVFEIGFSRTRPYTRLGFFSGKKRILDITPRERIASLSIQGYALLHSELLEQIRALLFVIREEWSLKKEWHGGPRAIRFERGIRFTIHHSDLACCAQFLLEDILFRRKEYFSAHAALLKQWMSAYVLNQDKYSEKQLFALKGVQLIVRRLDEVRYTPHYVREIYKRLTPFEQDLLERITAVARISFALEGSFARLIDWAALQGYARIEGVQFRLVRDHQHVQGKRCLVFEVFFEKEYREKHEIPF